jgi:mRNA interferase RelE/StbE
MSNYRVELSATAERQLRKLERNDQVQVVGAIQRISTNPRPRGSRKLRGYEDVFRIRTGVFRIIYSIEKGRLLIIILKPGHRKDIYRL